MRLGLTSMKNNKYLDHCVLYEEDNLEKYIISSFLGQMLMIEEKMLISSELSS